MRAIELIRENKETVLTGEIGALLHDIGKFHPHFIGTNSIENIPQRFPHSKIDGFLKHDLVRFIKNSKFEIKINGKVTDVYKLITKHHDYNTNDEIVKFLQGCDRKDSADDKGMVRKKQSIKNTVISSPFGYPKEKIDLNCLQKRFKDLEDNLSGLFKNYISGTISLSCFRESLINNLKTVFSHALGETRIPANDVTLWDHSYSTASLFKTALAAMICGASPDPNNLKWRIFGICWNGVEFINKGRKIAEIQARSEIIENIKRELKRKFEDEIPIGNAVYEDTNGIYFTFPEFDGSKELAKECVKDALKIIYDESNSELWPFFTLSKATGTLTIIAKVLRFASERRRTPKMSPTMFIEKEIKRNTDENWDDENIESPLDLDKQLSEEITKIKNNNEDKKNLKIDICPVCGIRPKEEQKERCNLCEDRRTGRLNQWLSNRQDTVWIDEVADKNNRIALISLNFYLDKWLDGAMIGTIYSQSFEDWFYGKKEKKENNTKVLKTTIELLREVGVNETLKPIKETVYSLLEEVIRVKNSSGDKKKVAGILDTFFQDVNITKRSLDQHIKNIEERIGTSNLTRENLATYLFTQNPSPARLYRIWQETEEFFDLVIGEIKDKIYSIKWKRIKFSVDHNDLKSKLNLSPENIEYTPLIIKIKGLNPEGMLVFHTEDGEFYTIESIEKFKFKRKEGEEETGKEAVKEALKQGIEHMALEDDPDNDLLKEKIEIRKDSIKSEGYYPLIEINRSPFSLRLIVPALDCINIIELITKLYNERFERVIGKLPLNIKLLVANRKFPLYVLLDAERRMLEGNRFKKQVAINPWWSIDGMRNDKYYSFYPVKEVEENEKYTLDDLYTISKGKIFFLYPGYFDFDLLLGTIDRYNIYYKYGKRSGKDYQLFTGRPYYFYQLPEMLELWNVLSANISSTQINFIEEMLTSKLREWGSVKNGNRQNIFREFAEATLKDAFGDKWNGLREGTKSFLVCSAINRLLLDTIILFRHIIKVKGVDKYE